MESSAQNSSGVPWCRHWVRFNEVPEKVPKVPEKVWEALVQSQVRFNRVPEKVPEKVWRRLRRRFWESLVQGQVRFNGFRRSEGSGEGCREGSGEVCFFCLFSCVCTLHTCKSKTLRLLGIPPKLICQSEVRLSV